MRGPSTPLSHGCWDWVALRCGTASQADTEQHCAAARMQTQPPPHTHTLLQEQTGTACVRVLKLRRVYIEHKHVLDPD